MRQPMDEAFLLRAKRLLDERRSNLDHGALVEKVSALAARTPTARAAALVNQQGGDGDELGRVSSLLLGDEEWRTARQSQGGCFNRAVVKRRVNTL